MSQLQIPVERDTATAESGSASVRACEPARHRRSWAQFSLRAFLVALTLVSVGLGWLGIQIEYARRQRNATEAMNCSEVGYSYERVENPDESVTWNKAAPHTTLAILRRICGDNLFSDVECLNTNDAQFDPSSLTNLSSLRSLRFLSLSTVDGRRKITDADLAPVLRLTHLRALAIDSSAVTDAGLQYLSGLTQLVCLELQNAKISGTGLAYLDNCKQLKSLELWALPLTDEGASYIGGLTGLEYLKVVQNGERSGFEPIGDSVLASCANLRRLQGLSLSGTHVTSAWAPTPAWIRFAQLAQLTRNKGRGCRS